MMVPLEPAMAIVAAFAVKHYVADFLMQTSAVARGKAATRGWLWPLTIHAGGHGLITLALALLVWPAAWWLAAVDFTIHAGVDRGKVLLARRMTLDPQKPMFWWLFGLDQLLHNLTDIGIVTALLACRWAGP